MSITWKVILGMSMPLAILIIVGVVSYVNLNQFVEDARWTAHTHEVIAELEALVSESKDLETGQRGFVITGREPYLEPYNSARKNINQHVSRIRSLTSDNPGQQQRLSRIEPLIAEKIEELEETIALRRDDGFEAARAVVLTGKGKSVMDRIRGIANEMGDEERRLIVVRQKASEDGAQLMKTTIIVGMVVGFVVVMIMGFITVRGLTESLSAIRSVTVAQSASAQEQASAVQETTTTLEEISAATKQTLEKAAQLGETAARTRQEGERGVETVTKTVEGIQVIRQRVEAIAAMNLTLSEKTAQIGDITTAVNNLAQESKMLALNAAIEAAKAGEAGKGFAVVAAEIRNLAEQSDDSTTQVQGILEDIKHATDQALMATEEGTKQVDLGVELMEQTGEVMNNLNDVVRDTEIASQQIVAAVQQGSAGVDQVTVAMSQINQVTIQFVTAVEQTNAAVDRLIGVAVRPNSGSMRAVSERA